MSRRVYTIIFISMFCGAVMAREQTKLPRYGQDFSFGIIEGAERLNGGTDTYFVTLTVMSAFTGEGNFSSPSGASGTFSFIAGQPTLVDLPQDLIQINDLGKT